MNGGTRPCVEAPESLGQECFGELAGPVSPEVEEENDISVANALCIGLVKNDGRQKLVCLALLVVLRHRLTG